jgi:hypothetical protein
MRRYFHDAADEVETWDPTHAGPDLRERLERTLAIIDAAGEFHNAPEPVKPR